MRKAMLVHILSWFLAAVFLSSAGHTGAADNPMIGVAAAPGKFPDAGKNWLVAVGINRYQEERVNALQFCKADAEAIYAFFTQSGVVPESSAYVLVSDRTDPKFHPTRLNILESVQYAAQKAGPDSMIILFFAGHGFVDSDGKSYLLPEDGRLSLLRDTGVSVDRVNEILRESQCKRKVVFMDACRNAPIRDGRGGVDDERTRLFLDALKSSAGQVTLAACNAGESSFEDRETGHGVFTLHVLWGLQGAAQTDRNGLINVSTLQQYLAEKVPAWAAKRRRTPQHPWMWGEMSVPIPLAMPGGPRVVPPIVDPATPTPSPAVVRPVSPPLATEWDDIGVTEVLLVTGLAAMAIVIVCLLWRWKRKSPVARKKPAGLEAVTLSPRTAEAPEAPPGPSKPQPHRSATAPSSSSVKGGKAGTGFPGNPLPEGLERARLVFEGAESGRKILLLAKLRLAVGVAKFTKVPQVDLTLRFLPCRSEEQDPENWQRNRLISSPHFTLEARNGCFGIRDEIQSKNGTSLIQLEGGEDDTSLSVGDTESVFETPSMAEGILPSPLGDGPTREGKIVLLPKGEWVNLDERCAISIGRRVMLLQAQVFSSKKFGLYALRLKRVENQPSIEYVQLIRRAYIGSDPKSPIRAHDSSFPRLAAAIDFKKGIFFLVMGQSETSVFLNHKKLDRNKMVPLTHASVIQIGDYRWRFEASSIDDFVEP